MDLAGSGRLGVSAGWGKPNTAGLLLEALVVAADDVHGTNTPQNSKLGTSPGVD